MRSLPTLRRPARAALVAIGLASMPVVAAVSGSWPIAAQVATADCAALAGDGGDSPRDRFAAGVCLAAQGRHAAAIAAFRAVAASSDADDETGAALHNLGTLLAGRGEDADALAAFRAALRRGDRPATRWNYELVARRARRPATSRPTVTDREAARMFAAARTLERPRPSSSAAAPARPDW